MNNVAEKTPSMRKTVLALLAIVAAGALLRTYRIDNPFGGYHAMNEAWFAATARNFSHSSFMDPTVTEGLVDYKVRPVFPYLSYIAIRVFGDNEAAPRLVSVIFSLLSLLFIFLIGRRLASGLAGLIAASFLAVEPAYTVLGRQAQPDAAYVSLMLAALLLYLISRGHPRESHIKLAAGIVWGLSIFTKNFAVLLLPGIILAEIIETRSIKWLNRRFLWFVFPAIVVPAPFIIYHAATHPGALYEIYHNPALRIPGLNVIGYMAGETVWAVSPPICLLGIIGLALSAGRRPRTGIWLSSLMLPFVILYFFMHVHSYYLLGLVPFLALAAALPFTESKKPVRWMPAILIVLIFTSVQTTLTLASVKWEQTRFKQVCEEIGARDRAAVILSDDLYENYRSLFYYYLPDAKVYYRSILKKNKNGYALIEPGRKIYMVDLLNGAKIQPGPYQRIYGQNILGFETAGHALILKPFNWHSFIPEKLEWPALPKPEGVGFRPVAFAPSIIVTEMPDGFRLRSVGGRWQFSP